MEKKIWCHPETAKLVMESFRSARRYPFSPISKLYKSIINHLMENNIDYRYNVELIESLDIPIWHQKLRHKWQFPKTVFVEYEEKDKEWAIPLRHGKWVDDWIDDTDRPALFVPIYIEGRPQIQFNGEWREPRRCLPPPRTRLRKD